MGDKSFSFNLYEIEPDEVRKLAEKYHVELNQLKPGPEGRTFCWINFYLPGASVSVNSRYWQVNRDLRKAAEQ